MSAGRKGFPRMFWSAPFRSASLLFWVLCAALPAQETPSKGPVLVATAGARDYLFGAGGTLARMIDEGRPVYIVQFGNDEKDSVGLSPSQTRLNNNADAERAAKVLGAKEVLNLGHKSGELAYISSSEMRNQLMALMRLYKPEILFFPDWYVHYIEDDVYRVGRMAEESPYGGGSYFLQELTYMGFPGYAAREYYFYSPYRPYRPREGGEGKAQMKHVDIGAAFERKVRAILELKTANQRYAVETRKRLELAGKPTAASPGDLVRAYLEELAATVGRKHGLRYAEEFNHLGQERGIPEHIRERAR
ncbi:MAG: PIG-L family deacetylase [Acidobacteria bacterium]|nr:PIG-L family deacetylase [Acidobacteriota bacterium]